MGLEVVTHISDLVITNPVGGVDSKSQGDDHIRNIKKALKTDFPNITGVVNATQTELNYLSGATGVTGTGNTVRATSPTLATPTLTGTTAAASLALTGNITITNATPVIIFDESDAAADERLWRMRSTGGLYRLSTYTDAGVEGTIALQIDRSGTAVTEIELNATALDFNGALDLSGAAVFNSTMQVTGVAIFNAVPVVSLAGVAGISMTSTGQTVQTILRSVDTASGGPFAQLGTLSSHALNLYTAAGLRLTIDSSGNYDFKGGTVTTNNASASEVGYKGMPQNAQAGNYTLVLSDAGKYIFHTTGGTTVTIPANASVAFPIGTIITIEAGHQTNVAITSDSLYLAGTGYATTGTRSIAAGGIATIHKRDATSWLINGVGVT